MAAISLTGDEYPLKTMLAKEVSGESLAAEPAAEVVQSQDEAVLAYYGKRQQLRVSIRNLNVVKANPRPDIPSSETLASCRLLASPVQS